MLLRKARLHADSMCKFVPSGSAGGFLDFPSAAILLRALAETYLSFRYMVSEPKSSEEREFREDLMDYHHTDRHLKVARTFAHPDASLSHALRRHREAGERLKANPLFRAQPAKAQKANLKEKSFALRELRDVARGAGIDPEVWAAYYVQWSQLAHSAPLGLRLFYSMLKDQAHGARGLASLLQVATCFLSKLILDVLKEYKVPKGTLSHLQKVAIGSHATALERMRPVRPDAKTSEAVEGF